MTTYFEFKKEFRENFFTDNNNPLDSCYILDDKWILYVNGKKTKYHIECWPNYVADNHSGHTYFMPADGLNPNGFENLEEAKYFLVNEYCKRYLDGLSKS